jgi:hypothetical protein
MQPAELDRIFGALADPTRRAILGRLARGDATVNTLVEPSGLSQPTVSKHLKILERADRPGLSGWSPRRSRPLRNGWATMKPSGTRATIGSRPI